MLYAFLYAEKQSIFIKQKRMKTAIFHKNSLSNFTQNRRINSIQKLCSFYLWAVLLFAFGGNAYAQEEGLQSKINGLKNNIKDVQTDKATFAQQLQSAGNEIFSLSYNIDFISPKGGSKQETYQFNLADLDANLINQQAAGNVMFVNLMTKNQQKLIKVLKNSVPQGYTNKIRIYAQDISNARELIADLKAAIPMASNQMQERLNLSNYDDMIVWLGNNIGSAQFGKTSIDQSCTFDKQAVGKVSLESVQSSGGKIQSSLFEFNLNDISPNLINFAVEGPKLVIRLKSVRGIRLIKVFINGQLSMYSNELEIYADNVDQARDISNILKKAVELSKTEVEASLPDLPNDANEIIQQINADIQQVEVSPWLFTQSINEGCVSEFTLVSSSSKGSKEENYAFNFTDLNPKLVDYKISKKSMVIELFTASGQNIIKLTQDGQVRAYTNQFSIYANDPETARQTVYRLKHLIGLCQENYTSPVPANQEEISPWLFDHITDIHIGNFSFAQKLSKGESENALRFEVTSANHKTSSHEIYEFNLCDIDPNSVNFFVKGKELFVKLETKYKQKIVKTYKNGKTQNYTNLIYIRINDIESARNMIEGFKSAIGFCS
jgi:hypothetical protein